MRKTILLTVAVLSVLGTGWVLIGRAAQSTTTQASPQISNGDYEDPEACIVCHADQGKHFQNTVMGKAFAKPKSEKEIFGCQACHGPAKNHVDSGGGKETIPIRFTKDSRNTVDEKN